MNKRSKNFLNYVSVSSFDKKQEANILIRIPEDEKEIKGALRFNYMIPVPEECIERLVIKDVEDEKYRLLLNKEYQFCMDNAERIQKKANKIYEMVTTNRKQKLILLGSLSSLCPFNTVYGISADILSIK